jgi:hypothetical protein
MYIALWSLSSELGYSWHIFYQIFPINLISLRVSNSTEIFFNSRDPCFCLFWFWFWKTIALRRNYTWFFWDMWVAQQGDGWLSREMGGWIGGWVAQQRDGWLSTEAGRWVAKLVARLLATAVPWIRIQTSLKNTKYISKGVANRLQPDEK